MKIILLLCTGNFYRSRFAEVLFDFAAPVECPGWTAISRGIAVDLGINNVGPILREQSGGELNDLIVRWKRHVLFRC